MAHEKISFSPIAQGTNATSVVDVDVRKTQLHFRMLQLQQPLRQRLLALFLFDKGMDTCRGNWWQMGGRWGLAA